MITRPWLCYHTHRYIYRSTFGVRHCFLQGNQHWFDPRLVNGFLSCRKGLSCFVIGWSGSWYFFVLSAPPSLCVPSIPCSGCESCLELCCMSIILQRCLIWKVGEDKVGPASTSIRQKDRTFPQPAFLQYHSNTSRGGEISQVKSWVARYLGVFFLKVILQLSSDIHLPHALSYFFP